MTKTKEEKKEVKQEKQLKTYNVHSYIIKAENIAESIEKYNLLIKK